jgi:amino acid transporter
MGLTYWIGNLSLPAIEALAVLTYLSGSFPELGLLEVKDGVSVLAWPAGILAGIALMAFFYAVNIFGVRLLSEANRWVTWWKILVPIATFLLLFFAFNSSNFTVTRFFPTGGGSVFETVAISGIAFTLTSFRGVLDFSGEVLNPKRTIPLGTIGCILIPLAIYVALQVAFIGAVNWSDAGVGAGDWTALAGSSWADEPLVHALLASSLAALGVFAAVLLIDAVVSPGASGYVFLGVTARVGFGLSIHGYFPKAFQKTNKHGVPWVSTVVSFVVGCLFFAPSPSWSRLAGFISTAMVLSALMAAVCLPVMRRYAPDLPRPFVLRQAGFWAPAGLSPTGCAPASGPGWTVTRAAACWSCSTSATSSSRRTPRASTRPRNSRASGPTQRTAPRSSSPGCTPCSASPNSRATGRSATSLRPRR